MGFAIVRGNGAMADVPADRRAAEDDVTVVEDGGLALGHAAGRAVQADAQHVVSSSQVVRRGPRRGRVAGPGSRAAPAAAPQPVQTGRVASISVTSRASAGPTVTVLDTGSMSST